MEKTLEAYFVKEMEELKQENVTLKSEIKASLEKIADCDLRYGYLSRENETLKKIICKFLGKVEHGDDSTYWSVDRTSYKSEYDYQEDKAARKEFVLLMEKAYEIQNENKENELNEVSIEKFL